MVGRASASGSGSSIIEDGGERRKHGANGVWVVPESVARSRTHQSTDIHMDWRDGSPMTYSDWVVSPPREVSSAEVGGTKATA